MYVTPEQIAAANKSSVEAVLGIAQSNFAAIEKISALNFNATKTAFEDGLAHAKALMSVKDAQEFVNVNAAAAQPAMEKMIAWQRSLYEVASQSQAEMTRYFETQAQEANKSVATYLDKFAKNAPAGSDVAVAAVKSAIAAANSAYDSFTKAAKQATEIAEANIAAVTAATTNAKKKAA
ncbi:MAG: TIGR01841 family phasin [Burkholderiales bacterium]|nr:TIGR01841 family phasin [Burkholderiales bacterium]